MTTIIGTTSDAALIDIDASEELGPEWTSPIPSEIPTLLWSVDVAASADDDDADGPWCDGPSWPDTDCACGFADDDDHVEAWREDEDERRAMAFDDAETFGREAAQ